MTRDEVTDTNIEMMDRRKLLTLTGAIGTGGLAGLSGCMESGGGGGGDGDGTVSGTTDGGSGNAMSEVVIAPTTGPTTLDPQNHREATTATILIHFYDGLVARDSNMEIQPRLAESWDKPDPETWEFTLREGVKFSNGEEFTAETVKYNLRRVSGQLNPDKTLPIVDQYEAIDTIEVLDDYQVRVNLKHPDPLFLETQAGLLYVPKKYTEENGFEALNDNPVGTGPFELDNWTRDERLVQTARSDYFRGEPAIEKITWRPMPESSSRLASLLDGSVHLIRSANPRSAERIKNNNTSELKSVRSARSAALWMNLEQDIPGRDGSLFYGEPNLRKAVNYAIDVEAIIENILQGYGYRSNGWAPSEQFVGYNSEIEPYPHDPEKAQELLEEAGYGDGFSARLLVPRERYFKGVEASEAIATQLGEVGIDVELNAVEFGQFAEQTGNHNMPEFMFAAWGNSTFNALDAYIPLVKSDQIFSLLPDEGRQEWVKTVDEKITQASQTSERDELDGILQELEMLMHEHAPFVFLFQYEDLYGVNNDLNWNPRSDEMMYLYQSGDQQ